MTAPKDIVARLRHAATTAANDDRTEAGTESRRRHVERVDAMLAAVDEITRLRTKAAQASAAGREDGARVATNHIGAAAKRRREKGFKLSRLSAEEQASISDEERGEDIAAEIIAAAIRALEDQGGGDAPE